MSRASKCFKLIKDTKNTAIFWFLLFVTLPLCQIQANDHHKYSHDEVTFALLLQTINFIEWPEENNNKDQPLIIGIYEDIEVKDALIDLLTQSSKSENIELVEIFSDTPKEVIQSLHILYMGNKKDNFSRKIMRISEGYPVLLVGSQNRFLERGGILNFINKNRKVTFEINIKKSKQSGISFRAKLLRLAERVKH